MEEREFTLLPYFAGSRIVSCSMCQLHLPHTCDKIGIPTVCRGVGWQMGELGGCQMKEMGRVAGGRDGEGGRWERWGGWQMGEMGREEVKDVNIHGRPSLHNINLTSSLVITS